MHGKSIMEFPDWVQVKENTVQGPKQDLKINEALCLWILTYSSSIICGKRLCLNTVLGRSWSKTICHTVSKPLTCNNNKPMVSAAQFSQSNHWLNTLPSSLTLISLVDDHERCAVIVLVVIFGAKILPVYQRVVVTPGFFSRANWFKLGQF